MKTSILSEDCCILLKLITTLSSRFDEALASEVANRDCVTTAKLQYLIVLVRLLLVVRLLLAVKLYMKCL